MTFEDMKVQVAAYMARSPGDFVINNVDLLSAAINRARKWAERRRDFELARVSAQLADVSITDGGDLADATLLGGGDPIVIKKIEAAFLRVNGVDVPIGIQGRRNYTMRLRRRYKELGAEEIQSGTQYTSYSEANLVRHGNTVYVNPSDETLLGGTTFTLYFDVVRMMPDYADYADTDFFLTYCEDFILFRSIFELNFMLKDDERVKVSSELLADSWATIKEWDDALISQSTDDTSLD